MTQGSGEKANLKLMLGIAGSVVSLLLVVCGVLIQAGFDKMSAEVALATGEIKVLSEKVARLETAVTYIDRYGLPAGPKAIPQPNEAFNHNGVNP